MDRARAELAMGEVETSARLLDEALLLWRGPAYADFAGEEWVEASVARLDAAHELAHELRVDADLAFGRHHELLPRIDELIVRFPYSDRLRGQRMIALYRSGRQVDALRDYQQYRQMLADEVGVEPGTDLAKLEQRIIAHDGDLLLAQPATRQVRDYQLGERVSTDEHAVVYRGFQPSVGRDVAVKVIRPEFANKPEFILRFEAEAQLVASLEHPHVVPLYDFWREPGSAYLVTRWLGGGSVKDRLAQDGPYSVEAAARLVDQVGSALASAHRSGITHGDLQPANVALDEIGNAYLSGFGITAALANGDAADTHTSPRSDIYALGKLLYEVILGTVPLGSSDDWPAEAPLRDLAPRIDAVVRRACASDPLDRFRDMPEMVVAVRAAVGSGDALDALAESREDFVTNELERVNPYKGLRAFGESDSADFFGRDQLTDDLIDKLDRSRFVAFVGPSGSGKSSVVRAGVVPRLRKDGAFVATMIPGARPFEELELALLRISPRTDPTLMAQLTATEQGFVRAVRGILPPTAQMLLVIDQFEELFTITEPKLRERFLDALVELVNDTSSPVRVVVTLRADFYDRPLLHHGIGPLVRDNTAAITPLDARELEEAITGPARRMGVDFDPALVANLVADAAQNPGTLPLLQYALTELYANRASRRITADEYQAMGGSSAALAMRADALFEELGDNNAVAVRRLFTQLVTPGDGTEDTRRRAHVSQLPGIPDIVYDVYARARLITFDRDAATREPTVEVAHEALIREWPRHREWVDEDRDALRVLRHLTTTARTWDDRGKDADELYRGARLAGATDFRGSHADDLGPLASDFLDQSIEAAGGETRRARRTTRRLRGLLVAAGVALLFALAAGLVAVDRGRDASDRAREAELASLLSASTGALDSDPQLATLLALEATRLNVGATSDAALFSALTNDSRRMATLSPGSGTVTQMALSGDGRLLALATDTSVKVFDLDELSQVGTTHQGVSDVIQVEVGRLSISADGNLVASIQRGDFGDDGADQTTLVDVASGLTEPGPVGERTASRTAGLGGFFSPTRDLFATTNGTTSSLWTTDPLDEVARWRGHVNAFSGDGNWIATLDAGLVTVTVVAADKVLEANLSSTSVDALGGISKRVNRPGIGSNLERVLLDSDGQHLIVHWSDAVVVHDLTGEEDVPGRRLSLPVDAKVSDVAVGPEGQIAVSVEPGTVQIFDLDSGESVGRPYAVRPGAFGVAVAFRPDGTLVTGGQAVTLWSTRGESPMGTIVVTGDYGARFSRDGSLLATTDREGNLFTHSMANGELLISTEIARNGSGVPGTPILFSGDNARLVAAGGTGSDNRPGSGEFGTGLVQVIDARTGNVSYQDEADADEMTALALSPDETLLAVGHRSGRVEFRAFPDVRTVISTTGTRLLDNRGIATGRQIAGLVFSSDGLSVLALTELGALGRLTVASGELEWAQDVSGQRRALAALGEDRVATATIDGTITIRDSDANPVAPALRGHTGEVTAMRAAGNILVTASLDRTVRFWDLDTGTAIGRPVEVDGSFIDLSEDGRWLAVVSDVGVSIWDLDPTTWTEAACKVAGRNLTQAEWDRFLPPDEPYHVTCARHEVP